MQAAERSQTLVKNGVQKRATKFQRNVRSRVLDDAGLDVNKFLSRQHVRHQAEGSAA